MLSFLKKKTTPLTNIFPSNFMDIHNHLIPEIDDGAKTLNDSVELIKRMYSYGIKNFMCTPHIMGGVYDNTPEIINQKLNELQGLILTTAFAAPMVAASGAITSLINGITGGGEESSDSAVAEKLDLILAAIKEGGDVIIDGNKVGESLMLASVKSS